MQNRKYIAYLNTLHNINANNQNAYTETNTTDPFYQKTMVDREVGKYIADSLQEQKPHILILTGHAGDGKTGLLFQVLKSWGGFNAGKLKPFDDVIMPNGKHCAYVKDFSELAAEERCLYLDKFKAYPQSGKYGFLVANTGPLIASFKQCFSEQALTQLIGAIDNNEGMLSMYDGVPIIVVNVATVDNAAFVEPFLKNVLHDNLWKSCADCDKRGYCAIYQNRNLMKTMLAKVSGFITKHYIWQQEHDTKLTIRQIVAHLSYTLTGGLECKDIKAHGQKFKFLFTNLFFGYCGTEIYKEATNIYAVNQIIREGYDQKRLRVDERLFIRSDFSQFPKTVQDIIAEAAVRTHRSELWQRSVRRAYFMLNIETSQEQNEILDQDVFSIWYPRYLELRSGSTPGSSEKELIQDALQMIFVGSIEKIEKEIPVTMKREVGISQCVQLVYDSVPKKKIKVVLSRINDYSANKRYGVYLQINGERMGSRITLPLFNFFEETRRGAIATNVDPQLSQGIDSLKAQIISYCDTDKSELELLTMMSSGWKSITAEYEDGNWTLG